jgi:hypothetical protein
MTLPDWVQAAIKNLEPPKTGKVVIEIECYMGGITKLEIGGHVRVKPENQEKEKEFAKA